MVRAQSLASTPVKSDWNALFWTYLFFWYFSGVHQLLLKLSNPTSFYGFRQALLVSTLWLIPLLLFPQQSRRYTAVLGTCLWLFSLVSLGYYFVYRQEISQSVVFIMFESNPAETSEYVAQYFAWWMVPALLLYTAGAIFLWRRIRPPHMARHVAWSIIIFILLLVLIFPQYKLYRRNQLTLPFITEKLVKRLEPAVPWQLFFGYTQYRTQLAAMQDLLEKNDRIPPLQNLKDSNAGLPATLVLVIGESTSRQHMSLYGYQRPTTPRLESMRDTLNVFTQAISPRPYTIEALQQILTFADQENPNLYLTQPSLMNMMKQAGYKTYWVTNQQTMTKRNTMLTSFSQQMDEQLYLNNSRDQNAREYDGKVLEPFNRMLNDPAERKFIVVHLLGTHMKYEYRYPQDYEAFKDKQGLADWVSEDQVPIINSYDNAVLYNDYVVSSLIESMDTAKKNGFLVYFSDHGEDVFDSDGHATLGRNEGKPTLPMYAVPFLLWQSDEWKKAHPRDFSNQLNRPYGTSHFIHTWADLAGIRFDGYDPSKSVVAKEFKERPLWVGDPTSEKALTDLRTLIVPTTKSPLASTAGK